MLPPTVVNVPFALNDDVIGDDALAEMYEWRAARLIAECVSLLNYSLKVPLVLLCERQMRRGVAKALSGSGGVTKTLSGSGGVAKTLSGSGDMRPTHSNGCYRDTTAAAAPRAGHLISGRYSAPEHYNRNSFILYRRF